LSSRPGLLSIIAYARSGALDYACRLFLESGFELVDDDPAVLSVRGRLLKDRALAADGAERRRLYLESADAYAKAGEIGGATYPLINAATLSLLAGKREQSRALAAKLLARIQAGGDDLETPYYRAATHAEALLLLGDIAKAKKAFAKAVALEPLAYEDHASTLRQFGMILGELGKDTAWLDPLRPPRSLHFAGHLALSIGDDAMRRRIRAAIRKERIGFGYGALASSADVLMAEALLEEGAELHLVLPAAASRFQEAAGFGDDWAKHVARILERAASIRSISGAPDSVAPRAIQLAAEIAMGRAVMQANVLMTEAVQIVICDKTAPAGRAAGGTAWIAAMWKKSGRRQHTIAAPRFGSRDAMATRAAVKSVPVALMAMLRIDVSGAGRLPAHALPLLARTLAKGPKPAIAPRWTGEAVLAAYAATAPAARAAVAAAAVLADVPGVRIAGHYAIAQRTDDPFGGPPYLAGLAAAMLIQMVASTPSGAVHVTEDFAAALNAGSDRGRPRTEYVGDLPVERIADPFRLYSLKA
jgi:hypothetical protein